MPTVNPSPWGPKPQFELSTGIPASGNKLFFYAAGSTTKQNTYTDSTGSVANANPLVLNTNGNPSTEIWFTSGQSYKVVYAPSTDTDPPSSPIWTVDNVRGINDITVTVDQWQASGLTPTFVGATQFTLPGDQTSIFQVNRRIKATVTAGTVYGYISASAFGAVTTVTVVLDSGALDSGLSAVSYGVLSALNASVPNTYPSASQIQNQSLNSATTGGSSTAYTLTLNPALTALATNQLAFATFHTAAGATPTLSINGLTAKNLKYRDTAGAKQAVTSTQIPTGWSSPVWYDGTDYVVLVIPPAVVTYPPSGSTSAVTFLGSDVALNNTANYFNVVNTGSIGANGQKWDIEAVLSVTDTAGAATILARIWDGTSVIYAETQLDVRAASVQEPVTLVWSGTLSGATTFHLSAKDVTSTSGFAKTSCAAGGTANKATCIRATQLT